MEKEKPFKCEVCGKRYKNLNGLKYVSFVQENEDKGYLADAHLAQATFADV